MVRTLLVDDDPDFLKLATKLLQSCGHDVAAFTNVRDGIQKLDTQEFDLILTDANLPEVNGFEFVKAIRRNPRHSQAAVALITGRREKRDVMLGLECGVDDYIIKPIDPDLFIQKVAHLLKKAGAEDLVIESAFVQSPVNIEAHVPLPVSITRVSEDGIQLTSPTLLSENFKFQPQTDLFRLIGIDTPTVRVISCVQSANFDAALQLPTYHVIASFVGVTENELQKIRFWINLNSRFSDDSERQVA